MLYEKLVVPLRIIRSKIFNQQKLQHLNLNKQKLHLLLLDAGFSKDYNV